MGDQRPEARLALAAVQVLGQRSTFDGKGHLGCERHQGVDKLSLEDVWGGQDEDPAALVARR